ncbi:MAG: hypothetical protein II955_00410, partial [Clostridia bacterium]|nr:hypothetical protein [Clostridia bacterium]
MKGSFKKIAAFLIVLAVIIPLCIVGASSDDPAPIVPNPNWGPVANDKKIFEISSAADLLAMAAQRGSYKSYEGYTISLTADIDLNPGWDASSKVAPTNLWPGMFYFYGTFDGAGHTIKGLCQMGAENGCFITCGLFKDGSTGIKNLQIENSYFQGTKNAGIISATRGTVLLENLYVDAIVESGDCAGGLVSWFFTSDATSTPKAVLTNCVFAGSVSAKGSAGGLVGTNNKTNAVGIGTYDIILTDCANYGTVVSETEGKVAGLIGSCVNNAKLTRCYNAGAAMVYTPEVPAVPATDTEPEIPAVPASTAPAPALLNVTAGTVATEAAPTVEILDCYYLAGEGVVGMAKAADATGTVTVKYAGVEATELATATVAELVAKNEFQANDAYKGWAANAENTLALPLVVYENINGHDFEDVVTAPTCSQEGYTTHTC